MRNGKSKTMNGFEWGRKQKMSSARRVLMRTELLGSSGRNGRDLGFLRTECLSDY